MKLNLGCGVNKIDGYFNVDKFDYGQPDKVMDLEITPWDFESDSVDEVMLNHTLEHLGQDTGVFINIIKEIYRVCKNDARVQINVPHPRHDNFINDPTHVRVVTPELMGLFSKKNCLHWQSVRAANSPLALYHNVDFELASSEISVEESYMKQLKQGTLTNEQLFELVRKNNNIATEYRMTLRVIK